MVGLVRPQVKQSIMASIDIQEVSLPPPDKWDSVRDNPRSLPPCVLCGEGNNHVQHWSIFCPVFGAAASLLLGKIATLENTQQAESTKADGSYTSGEKRTVVIVSHLIHQTRILLLAAQALTGQEGDIPGISFPQHLVVERLVREVEEALPIQYKPKKQRTTRLDNHKDCQAEWCSLSTRRLTGVFDKLGRRTALRREILVTADMIQEGEFLYKGHQDLLRKGWYAKGKWMPPLLDASWSADTLISESNVTVTKNTCECGCPAYEVMATKPIPKGHPLMVELRTERPTQKTLLLAQFDGSCHDAATEEAAAGCGVVVWKSAPGQPPELVARLSIPLLEAITAPESEAAGAAHALLTLGKVAEGMEEAYDVLIQGDNKAIMDFWNGDANLEQAPQTHGGILWGGTLLVSQGHLGTPRQRMQPIRGLPRRGGIPCG